MKVFSTLFAILFPLNLTAQIITLFAGNGGDVYNGDNGPATIAGIPSPGGGAFDKVGNYYFADLGAKRVRKIDTSGIITTVVGSGAGGSTGDGGPATNARLTSPNSVKLDTFGNLYIADGGNNNVRKVNISTGFISTIAGTGTGSYTGDNMPATMATLYDPQNICIDKKGNIFVADGYNFAVRKIDHYGIISTYAGIGVNGYSGDNGPATAAKLGVPTGLAIDDTGNLYITDVVDNRVRKVDTFGNISTFAGNGVGTFIGDGVAATAAQINPTDVAIDSDGNVFISDRYNQRVYLIGLDGIIYTIAGNGIAGFDGDGLAATTAELYTPTAISLDACGNLYIAETGTISITDSGNNIRVVLFNPTCDPYRSPLNVRTNTIVGINIFPNPTTTTINITGSINALTITNLIGQTVYQQQYHGSKAEVDISHLQPGVYMAAITDEEGRRTVKKIVKE